MASDYDSLRHRLYNHAVLPRDVPGQEDSDLYQVEARLLRHLLNATKTIKSHACLEHQHGIDAVRLMLTRSASINIEGKIDKHTLMNELDILSKEGDHAVLLFVAEQNAALLVYSQPSFSNTYDVIFEAFETAAPCEATLSAHTLQWDFPGQAVLVPSQVASMLSFRESLSHFLEKASIESVKQFSAVTYKAAAPQPEIRDSTDPALITGLLMSILRANGEVHVSPLLRKRVRDTVSFRNGRKPWRRSPFYLAIRVAIQRHVSRMFGGDVGRAYYKVIMCEFFACLLDDSVYKERSQIRSHLSQEAIHFLVTKLCYRVAKLEVGFEHACGQDKDVYASMLKRLTSRFEASIKLANGYLQNCWARYKSKSCRSVPFLRNTVSDIDKILSLRLSRSYLQQIYPPKFSTNFETFSPTELLLKYRETRSRSNKFFALANSWLALFDIEQSLADVAKETTLYHDPGLDQEGVCNVLQNAALTATTDESQVDFAQRCVTLAQALQEYILRVKDDLEDYPQLKGRTFLILMELWVAMDQNALMCFDLLADYHPGFGVELLDALHISTLDEMNRLNYVQAYISRRIKGWSGKGSKTIFSNPAEDSFAVRYFDDSADTEELKALRRQIQDYAEQIRSEKEEEWAEKSQEFEELERQILESSCTYVESVDKFGSVVREHDSNCHKHALLRKSRRMRIQVIEYPLPSNDVGAKAAVFELRCPTAFAAYRDSTWQLLSSFAYPDHNIISSSLTCHILFRDYLGFFKKLRGYDSSLQIYVTLGSTKKPFSSTHYESSGFPVKFDRVCRRFPLTLEYFDSGTKQWTVRPDEPSLLHHFRIKVPKESPYEFLVNNAWPSSNRIISSQTKCPVGITNHEFTSLQGLMVGTHVRWITLLREMGSTNLNFSSDSTWAVVTRLALQAGPFTLGNPLREVHAMFEDYSFCQKLVVQISHRLQSISRNWREPSHMDILITLLLRLCNLTPILDVQQEAVRLLRLARHLTEEWRAQINTATGEDRQISGNFGVWAAILCKRTFQIYPDILPRLQYDDLRCWIGASIALQDSFTDDFANMPYNLRNAMLEDIIFNYRNRSMFWEAVIENPACFHIAVSQAWPLPYSSSNYTMTAVSESSPSWIEYTWKTNEQNSRVKPHCIHFNYVFGNLLISGEELGRLPQEYRNDSNYQIVIAKRNPRVYPSNLAGMSYTLADMAPNSQRVHLGFEKARGLVIRVVQENCRQRQKTLEYIPRSIYSLGESIDIPSTLINDCYHWLDLDTGIIEVRRKDRWKTKPGNWRINIRDIRHVYAMRRESTLIDPNSFFARKITQIFNKFELMQHITIFQTRLGKIAVELRRFDLAFEVWSNGLLYCREFDSIIPINQDIGTWVGLRSKIMLQSLTNRHRRSVLVPAGVLKSSKDGEHVAVDITMTDGIYMRFTINEVLGRIECPMEPRMLYMKAQLHAYTSHFLPDLLTGRTGLDEAIHYLSSATYQPWNPLGKTDLEILKTIAELTPRREFYPKRLQCMETVFWRPELSTFIQDDRYRGLVERIYQRHLDTCMFTPVQEAGSSQSIIPSSNNYLETRSILRMSDDLSVPDKSYIPRDRLSRPSHATECDNAYSVTKLLADMSPRILNTTNLAKILAQHQAIGGYTKEFDRFQLTELLTVDLGKEWGALGRKCMTSTIEMKFDLMFLLATIAFSESQNQPENMDLIRALVSYAIIPELKEIPPPSSPSFLNFSVAMVPEIIDFAAMMNDARIPFVAPLSLQRGQLALVRIQHEKESLSDLETLAQSIISQWPNPIIRHNDLPVLRATHVDVKIALALIETEWTRLIHNHEFSRYLEKVQLVLFRYQPVSEEHSHKKDSSSSTNHSYYPSSMRKQIIPYCANLLATPFGHQNSNWEKDSCLGEQIVTPTPITKVLQNRTNGSTLPPSKSPSSISKKMKIDGRSTQRSLETELLRKIVKRVTDSQHVVQRQYGTEMEHSIDSLDEFLSRKEDPCVPLDTVRLEKLILSSHNEFLGRASAVREESATDDVRARWLRHAGLWPKLTIVQLLSHLATSSDTDFGHDMREALINLGIAITKHQRFLRIYDAFQRDRKRSIEDEWANSGHQNWNPYKSVDWLIMEIDSDLMIRAEQVEVAKATIKPLSGQNSVLQLLMGKGKTSVILPMVASVLADKRNLTRIIVPRSLLTQSTQIMQMRLGNLLNREIIHVPFSRKTPTDDLTLRTFKNLHRHVIKHKGVVLALPEHILSFRLSGLQRLCDGRIEEASTMVKIQANIDKCARDVLDECDVLLAIRTQLIYPSGSQMTMDGHPLRWQTIETVLRIIRSYLPLLIQQFPRSIEVVERAVGGYQLIYFLRPDVEDYLIKRLVFDICSGQTQVLPIAEYPNSQQKDIETFISNPTVSTEVYKRVIAMFKDKIHLMKVTYLLRGLFVHRILLSTLKKRWNVQYGLHPQRDPIAVPYHSKGTPSPSAEWGHPDVAITLTCMSFYYDGLSAAQFRQSFEQLLKSDEPSVEYEKWATSDLPEGLRDYTAINTEDAVQIAGLHSFMQHNVFLVDFFMNNFVFPRHAKQFKSKLEASGWDLVSFDPASFSKFQTTGFSGTNDTRHHLPLTIKQNDLIQLSHTNAEVPYYLLQTRNRTYIQAKDGTGKRLSERGILEKLLSVPCPTSEKNDLCSGLHLRPRRIRILIDAGAQIIEHDNESLARTWLDIDHEAEGAVFFSSDHKPWLCYRNSRRKVPLVASPFADDLENCLVYLDESHCRGTDLKLPTNAIAALTLGPHLTKDALAQAAMRLRLLGTTQSIVFFSPPEVHQSILDLRNKDEDYNPNSADVIFWLLIQTCNAIEQLEPLYYSQGCAYLRRVQAKLDCPDFILNETQREQYLAMIVTKELNTLKQQYGPKSAVRNSSKRIEYAPSLQDFDSNLQKRKQEFQDRGFATHSSALEEVEQEREIEFEIESVREIQAPVQFIPRKYPGLHADILSFAKTGRLIPNSDQYLPMFSVLQETALGKRNSSIFAGKIHSKLWVSKQFTRTVNLPPNERNDNFLRPGHWVVWSSVGGMGLLVCTEEADCLIPALRDRSNNMGVHLIVYAPPMTRKMLHFNNLDYFAIPPLPAGFTAPNWLKIELGIFLGRLYFSWDEYPDLLRYLGLSAPDTIEKIGDKVEGFAKKPLTFMHDWLAIRLKGQDFEQTPMGFITTGKPLSSNHPFFLAPTAAVEGTAPVVIPVNDAEEDSDSDDDREEINYSDGKKVDEGVRLHYGKEKEDLFFDAKERLDDSEEDES
ncbi:hypothetical protein B0J11DRAFT_571692 [Dendryphion nanum]|uniref:ubiquitinyl hydrolase 1 n=1 Tax=Dendryphion nanum TaxID=256645 RepID=A0A9P9IBZ4_9PLEO|nr:hypothetical protein B0J11DRAFT_571692 [Dendryphion nanum]